MGKKYFIFLFITVPLFRIYGETYCIGTNISINYLLDDAIINQNQLPDFDSTQERNNYFNKNYSFQIFCKSTNDYFFSRSSRFYLENDVLERLMKNPNNTSLILREMYNSDQEHLFSDSEPLHKIGQSYKKLNDEKYPMGEEYVAISPSDGGFAPLLYSISRYFLIEEQVIRLSLYYHDYSNIEAKSYSEIFEESNTGYRYKSPVETNIYKYQLLIISDDNKSDVINKLFDYWEEIIDSIEIIIKK